MDVVAHNRDIHLNQTDAEDPEMSDYVMLPDMATLSERLWGCLQKGDENPWDFTVLFDLSVYQLDTTSLPKVIKAHQQLNVKHRPPDPSSSPDLCVRHCCQPFSQQFPTQLPVSGNCYPLHWSCSDYQWVYWVRPGTICQEVWWHSWSHQ